MRVNRYGHIKVVEPPYISTTRGKKILYSKDINSYVLYLCERSSEVYFFVFHTVYRYSDIMYYRYNNLIKY